MQSERKAGWEYVKRREAVAEPGTSEGGSALCPSTARPIDSRRLLPSVSPSPHPIWSESLSSSSSHDLRRNDSSRTRSMLHKDGYTPILLAATLSHEHSFRVAHDGFLDPAKLI